MPARSCSLVLAAALILPSAAAAVVPPPITPTDWFDLTRDEFVNQGYQGFPGTPEGTDDSECPNDGPLDFEPECYWEAGDQTGHALAVGDFDCDGDDDIVIGIPGEDAGQLLLDHYADPVWGEGNVAIVKDVDHGRSVDVFSQDELGLVGEQEDGFGEELAVGDFNGDGCSDLAVATPHENNGGDPADGVGRVTVMLSPLWDGSFARVHHLDRRSWGVEGQRGDLFGSALAAGDFDGDGRDELAIGVPNRGGGEVLFAEFDGGNTFAVGERWAQGVVLPGVGVAGEQLGAELVAGNFDGDAFDDLAIASPYEAYEQGSVTVAFGRASRTTPPRTLVLSQSVSGVPGSAENHDLWGETLGVGDFDGNGVDDLVVGCPEENDEGSVTVFPGFFPAGPAIRSATLISVTEHLSGVCDGYPVNCSFGASITGGDLNGDGRDELVVGVEGYDLDEWADTRQSGGAVYVFSGTSNGVNRGGYARYDQDRSGVEGVAEKGNRFGAAVAAGDFDGDGEDDLVVGVPGENADAGVVQLFWAW